MHSPKLMPQMATDGITQPAGPPSKAILCLTHNTLRCLLLAWASLRLAVSTIWTLVIIIETMDYYLPLWFGILATLAQLVEYGMLVTFIGAGFKKSVQLYQSYWKYCKTTLWFYILAVLLCFRRGYHSRNFFGEIYITYHFVEFGIISGNDAVVFGVAAFLDVCLEIFLIKSVKILIDKYSPEVPATIATATGENV